MHESHTHGQSTKTSRERFPLGSLALAVLAGAPALAIALLSALFATGFDAHPDDVLLTFNGHQVGGTFDRIMSVGAAVAFGTTGVFCLLRFWRKVEAWWCVP